MENKTVYFLGAGASFGSDFNLPVMRGFFREEDFNSGKYSNLHKFIKENFPKVYFKDLNLEEIITFLELSIDKFASFGKHPEVYLYEARREFDRYVNARLTIPGQKGCDKHNKIFNSLAGENSTDTVITINYDLVVDNTLYELSPRNDSNKMTHKCLLGRMYSLLERTLLMSGERPSLYHTDKKLGFYLKLHGSIDWIYCTNQSCGNHQLFFPNWIDSPEVHDAPGDLCSLCGAPLVSVIVPPTMHKSFENFPKLGLLWSLAYREIKDCDRFVIIGVSLAESDYYLNWLLKSTISNSDKQKYIEIVNKDEGVCKKVEGLTGIKPKFLGTFDKYVGEI